MSGQEKGEGRRGDGGGSEVEDQQQQHCISMTKKNISGIPNNCTKFDRNTAKSLLRDSHSF